MIIIREVFIAKPGMASKLAKLMSLAMQDWLHYKVRIMTDLTGVFNKVVLETEMENLAAFEQRMQEYRDNAAFREKMKGYVDMYQSGKREIYQVVE